MTEVSPQSSLLLARLCGRALEDKLAASVRILDVSVISSITNFIVIGTATSQTHVRALRVELEKVLDQSRNRIVGMDTAEESGWTVVDAFDVMVHVFTEERRRQYGLETLWKDAPEVSVSEAKAGKLGPKVKKAKGAKSSKGAKVVKTAKSVKTRKTPTAPRASKAP